LVGCIGVGCKPPDRYELQQNNDGRTFRLDRRTGEVAILSTDGVRILETEADRTRQEGLQRLKDAALANPKYWPGDSIPHLKIHSTMLATVYRRGALRYQLVMTPMPRGYPGYSADPFTLVLSDSAGFTVGKQPLLRSELTREIDANGKPSGLSAAGTIPMTPEEYQSIASFSLTWRF
jgi:hypothetical protein